MSDIAVGFRPAAGLQRTVRWRAAQGTGLEHLHIAGDSDGTIAATGIVIGERGGRSYGMCYRVKCDPAWRVLDFSIDDANGMAFAAWSDKKGNWRKPDGEPLADLSGAIDIDLAGTPLTNTLPIRRSGLNKAGQSQEFSMLYVPFDTLRPVIDRQRYTCIEPFSVYRYEAVDRDFKVDLQVDHDGLVLDYPTLFCRN